ncbi:hypothetical protein IF650_06040 [Cellulosimicrobium terreum]|nr:hypothetical protein [Cellulosimicrobium terreum]
MTSVRDETTTDDRSSRVSRAVAGVVVGFVGLALVALVVVVVGYHALVSGWARQHDTPAPVEVAGSTEATNAVGPGEGLDASNEAYRQRMGSAEGDAQAALALPDVQAALDPLATGGPVDRDDAYAALAAAGFTSVQVTPETSALGGEPQVGDSFGIGVSVPGGCVFGEVAPDAVTLEAGGPIADGGCLAMPGH